MDSTKKHQVRIVFGPDQENPVTRGILALENRSLLENLLDNNVNIDHSCGGNGTCGTCQYEILQGQENLSEIEEVESEMREDRGFAENERLACQSYLKGNIKIRIQS